MIPVYARSEWTSSVPRPAKVADLYDDLDYFTPGTVKGSVVHYAGGEYPLLNYDPAAHFENVRRYHTLDKNLSDIAYNLGVSPRVRGVWELRGLQNKSSSVDNPVGNDKYISIYCQLAIDEKPTDILLENLRAAVKLVREYYPRAQEVVTHAKLSQKPVACPGELLHQVVENKVFWESPTEWAAGPVGNFFPQNSQLGDTNIRVFDLVSHLAAWGYFRGKNTGQYNSVVEQAVKELQADLKEGGFYERVVDGVFGPYTRQGWRAELSKLHGAQD